MLDSGQQVLRFTDIDVDVKSRAAYGLLGAAARAALPYLQDALAENARIDLKPLAANARANIEAALADFRKNEQGVQVDATITELRLAGIEYDAQVVKEGEGGGVFQQGQTRAQAGSMGGFNLNWDATWQVATSIDGNGWYAEFRIPFSTLRYGAGATQVLLGTSQTKPLAQSFELSHCEWHAPNAGSHR